MNNEQRMKRNSNTTARTDGAPALSPAPREVGGRLSFFSPRRSCLAAIAVLALAAPAAQAAAGSPTLVDNLPRFLGRLHPVLVHFPIALIIAGVLFECVAILVKRDRSRPSAAGLACVIVGALGAGVAAWAGCRLMLLR